MSRLSIELTQEQHQRLKAMAALHGKSIKNYVLDRSLPDLPDRESMTEDEVEIILLRAKEKHPDATPRIISDNGPQFLAKDFKEFI